MSITIRFLRERGDLRWRAIECVLVQFDLKTESGYTNSINIYLFLTGAILSFLCPKRNFGRHIVMICVKLAS